MPPRVLLVTQPTDGGVARHVATLASRLGAHGVTPTVACPPGPWADRLAADGIDVVAVPMVREIDPAVDVDGLRRLSAAVAGGGYDLVHTHSAKAGVLGRLAARRHRVPTVHTPHAWSFLAAGSRPAAAVYRRVERTLAAHTDAIICVSDGERRRGAAVVGDRRLVVVHNGLDAPAPPPRPSPTGKVVVGTVARLAPQKGVADLLDAMTQVRAARDDVQLLVAGDGPSHDALVARAARLGLDGTVRFLGAVDQPWSVLAELDVFVLPSRWEGLPYALLEAMAAGLPCVATAVDGVAEAIPDRRYGTVVAPGDPDRLAREILALVDDPTARATIGSRARTHVRRRFSVDAMVAGTVDVYDCVLGVGRAGDPAGARPPPVAVGP